MWKSVVVTDAASPTPSWVPSTTAVESARIVEFARWLGAEGTASFANPTDYAELQAWSGGNPGEF